MKKNLRITVNGKAYEVTVETIGEETPTQTTPPVSAPAPAALAAVSAPQSAPSAPKAAAGDGAVVCPISGRVVSVDVRLGLAVEEGAQLATVEAMKMNTYIYAPRAGVVAEINTRAGEGVEEGMVILRLK